MGCRGWAGLGSSYRVPGTFFTHDTNSVNMNRNVHLCLNKGCAQGPGLNYSILRPTPTLKSVWNVYLYFSFCRFLCICVTPPPRVDVCTYTCVFHEQLFRRHFYPANLIFRWGPLLFLLPQTPGYLAHQLLENSIFTSHLVIGFQMHGTASIVFIYYF